MMSRLFAIPVSGIKDGHHIFEFEITKEFFDLFDESEIREGELAAVVNVEKNSSHLDLDITISGKVRTCCDRCLGIFDYPVECVNSLLVKFQSNLLLYAHSLRSVVVPQSPVLSTSVPVPMSFP